MSVPTNGEVAEVLRKEGYNTLIQRKMEDNQAIIQRSLRERTGCTNTKFIPVPNLFFGGQPLEPRPEASVIVNGRSRRFAELNDDERERLPVEQRYTGVPEHLARGLLPNPTNALVIGNTIIGPKPWNAAFRNYLGSAYNRLGVTFREADTWKANVLEGNLHCSTNTMRVCRPAAATRSANQ